jgi:DNA-binding MarR family transcriptional regulator
MSLRRAYLAMHRRANAAVAAAGLTADQFVLLVILSDGVERTQVELVEATSSDPNTIRAMLLLLEKAGLILRQNHPTDRRAWNVSLTADGRKVVRRLVKKTQGLRDFLVESTGGVEAATKLTNVLEKLACALNARE